MASRSPLRPFGRCVVACCMAWLHVSWRGCMLHGVVVCCMAWLYVAWRGCMLHGVVVCCMAWVYVAWRGCMGRLHVAWLHGAVACCVVAWGGCMLHGVIAWRGCMIAGAWLSGCVGSQCFARFSVVSLPAVLVLRGTMCLHSIGGACCRLLRVLCLADPLAAA
jgi:hypothetical protein